MKNGYEQGNMKPEVSDCQVPDAAYAENFNQSTLRYKERNNAQRVKEAGMVRKQSYKGRYS